MSNKRFARSASKPEAKPTVSEPRASVIQPMVPEVTASPETFVSPPDEIPIPTEVPPLSNALDKGDTETPATATVSQERLHDLEAQFQAKMLVANSKAAEAIEVI